MRLLDGKEYADEALVIREHFLSGAKPSNFAETIVGTAAITYPGADAGTGKVLLTVNAQNDSLISKMNIPFMLNKWSKVELTFHDVMVSVNDGTKAAFLVGARLDGSNFVSFGQVTGTSVNCRVRNAGTETTSTVSPFDPLKKHRYRIVMTTTRVDFYIDSSLVATITTNIPSAVSLVPTLFLQHNEAAGAAKTLECDRMEMKFFK